MFAALQVKRLCVDLCVCVCVCVRVCVPDLNFPVSALFCQSEDLQSSFHWALGTLPFQPQANELDGLPAQS